MHTYNRVLKNVFSNWAGFAANLAIAFLLSPFIVHTLGNAQYGLWVILNQFTGYLGILDLGVRSSVVKYVATYRAQGDHTEMNRIVNGALAIYSAVAIVSLVISAALAVFFPGVLGLEDRAANTARIVLVLSGVTVAQGFVFNVFYGVLIGIQRYDVFNRIGIVASILKAIIIVIVLRYGYGIIALAVIQLVVSVVTNVTAYRYCRQHVPELALQTPRRNGAYGKIATYSLTTFFVTISQKIIFQTDALVIGSFMSVAAVTFYAIPVTLVEYMRRIVIAMTETFVPLTSQLKAKSADAQIHSLLIRGTRISVLVGMAMGVILLTMGERFIELWMGADYANQGGAVLQILAVTQILSFGHLASREVLNGLALHRLNAYCYGAEAIGNLVLSLALVKPLGIVGVALGTAIPHAIVTTVVFPIVVSRTLHVSVRELFTRAIAPGLAAGIPLAMACFIANRYFPAHSLLTYAAQLVALSPVFALGAWQIGLSSEDRATMRVMLARQPLIGRLVSAL